MKHDSDYYYKKSLQHGQNAKHCIKIKWKPEKYVIYAWKMTFKNYFCLKNLLENLREKKIMFSRIDNEREIEIAMW